MAARILSRILCVALLSSVAVLVHLEPEPVAAADPPLIPDNPSKKPGNRDPNKDLDLTLDEFIENARQFRADAIAAGKSVREANRIVAEYISSRVDRRLIANNKRSEGDQYYWEETPEIQESLDVFDKWRRSNEHLKQPLGKMGEYIAKYVWELGVGNCAESSAVAQYVAIKAGIPAKVFSSGVHQYAVIGLDPGAKVEDPSTWGENAYAVDGWQGHAVHSSEINNWSNYIMWYPNISDQTSSNYDPELYKRWQAAQEQKRLKEGGKTDFPPLAPERLAPRDIPDLPPVPVETPPPETPEQKAKRMERERLQDRVRDANKAKESAQIQYEEKPNDENYFRIVIAETDLRLANSKLDLQLVIVPDVRGYPVAAATDELSKKNLRGQPVPGAAAKTEKQTSQVYEQIPAAGSRVPAGFAVKAMYFLPSKGSTEALKVPDITGMPRAKAEALLASKKLKAKATPGTKGPSVAKLNEVYVQVPKAGTTVKDGDIVDFQYYTGVPVGKYIGMTKEEAVKAIKSIGLVPDVNPGDLQPKEVKDNGKVYKQFPQPDELASAGDIVSAQTYKFERGFQEGDGELVDGRFKAAKVSEDRNSIEYNSGKQKGGNETNAVIGWTIKKYDTAEEARKEYAKVAKMYPDIKSVAGFRVIERSVGDTSLTIMTDLKSDRNEGAMLARVFVHREFLVQFGRVEPKSGFDFGTENARVVKKSKELIDLRFPPE